MTKTCVVPNCRMTLQKIPAPYKLIFRTLPKDLDVRSKWITMLKMQFEGTDIDKALERKQVYVCDLHFEVTCYNTNPAFKQLFLRRGSVPTIFSDFKSFAAQAIEEKYRLLYGSLQDNGSSNSSHSVDDGSQAGASSMDAGDEAASNNLELENPESLNLNGVEFRIDPSTMQSIIKSGPTDAPIIVYSYDEVNNLIHTQYVNYSVAEVNNYRSNDPVDQHTNESALESTKGGIFGVSTYGSLDEATSENPNSVDDGNLNYNSNQLPSAIHLTTTDDINSNKSLEKSHVRRNLFRDNDFKDIMKKSLLDLDVDALDYNNPELMKKIVRKGQFDMCKQEEQLLKYRQEVINLSSRMQIYEHKLKEIRAKAKNHNLVV